MLLYVAGSPKLVEARLAWRDQLHEVCIALMGQPIIGVVLLSPSARPVVRPVARFVVVVLPLSVRPVSSCAVGAIFLICLFCPSVCSRGFCTMEHFAEFLIQ